MIFLRSKALSKRRLGLEFGVSCMSLLHLIFFGTEGSNGTISGRQRKTLHIISHNFTAHNPLGLSFNRRHLGAGCKERPSRLPHF